MCSALGENWRSENRGISGRLKVILRHQKFSDVTIVVQSKEFKCHRLILATGSPYFERTFYHTFKNLDHHASSNLTLSDVTPEAFQCVLNFLYTDNVTFGNETQAFQTWEAAEKFQILDLKSECEIYLSELDFRPKTVWNKFRRATALGMDKMSRKCMAYIQNNTLSCLQDGTFVSEADSEVLLQVLRSERLAISEADLLNCLAAWGTARKGYRPLKQVLEPFLRLIRFRALSPKEFCQFLEKFPGLMESSDCLAILQHLELPYKNSLPSWCCRSPRRIWPY